MNELMQMQSLPIKRKEYDGQPVVTFRDVDELHQKNEGTARKRFNDNRKHFQEGVDYFVLNSDEASSRLGIIAPCGLKLLTQTGYLMIVKSFTDDLSYASKTAYDGQTVSIDVTAAVKAMKTNKYTGLMLYNPDTTTVGSKSYTASYARFAGKGESGAPVLKVSYRK